MTKKALIAEYGRLVDEQFLHGLPDKKAARLAVVKKEIDRCDAPKIRRLNRETKREFAEIDQRIAILEAKIAEHGSGSPKAKTASSQ